MSLSVLIYGSCLILAPVSHFRVLSFFLHELASRGYLISPVVCTRDYFAVAELYLVSKILTMASGLGRSKHEGKASLEYKVVKSRLTRLVKQTLHSLDELTNGLFSKGLISKLEHSDAMNANQPTYHRATNMMSSVLTKIEKSSLCYHTFIEALREAEFADIAKELESSLDEMKVQCSTDSAAGDLLQNNVARLRSSTVGREYRPRSKARPPRPKAGPPLPKAAPCRTNAGSSSLLQNSLSVVSESEVCGKSHPSTNSAESSRKLNFVSSSTRIQADSLPTGEQILPSCKTSVQDNVDSPSNEGPVHCENLGTGQSSLNVTDGNCPPNVDLHPGIGKSGRVSKSSHKIDSSGNTTARLGSMFRPLSFNRPQQCDHPVGVCRGVSSPSPVGDDMVYSTKTLGVLNRRRCSHCLPQATSESGEKAKKIPIQSIEAEESEDYSPHFGSKRDRYAAECCSDNFCFCHHELQLLQKRLRNHDKEIELLKDDIAGMEKYIEIEKCMRSKSVHKIQELKAERMKMITVLKEKMNDKDDLIDQLAAENVDYEKKIQQLEKQCGNPEERKLIKKQRAAVHVEIKYRARCKELENEVRECKEKLEFGDVMQKAEEITKCHQYKVLDLTKALDKVKEQETKSKELFVSIDSELTVSELDADELAQHTEKVTQVIMIKVPILKTKLILEGRRSVKEKDSAGVKETDKLIKKMNHLLYVRMASKQSDLESKHGAENAESCREELDALNLFTPDINSNPSGFSWL